MGWNIAIAAVVVLGVLGVILAVSGNKNEGGSGAPHFANASANQAGDHWHTYLGVDICGEWLSNVPAFENVAQLDKLPVTGAFVIALPMKIGGGSGGPLRIVALLP